MPKVDGFRRNGWTECPESVDDLTGMGGRLAPESVDGMDRNQWTTTTGICKHRHKRRRGVVQLTQRQPVGHPGLAAFFPDGIAEGLLCPFHYYGVPDEVSTFAVRLQAFLGAKPALTSLSP